MTKAPALIDKEILFEFVNAAREFTSGKAAFLSFVEATLRAEHHLIEKGSGFGKFECLRERYRRISTGLAVAVTAIHYFLPDQAKKSVRATEASPEGRSALNFILLNASAGSMRSNLYRGLAYRDYVTGFASAVLLKMAREQGINCTGLSESAINRAITVARKEFIRYCAPS